MRRCLLTILVWLLWAGAPTLAASADRADPELVITQGEHKETYKRSQLLSRPDLTTLTITDDPTYPKHKMIYKAVPLAQLFKAAGSDAASVQFICSDGFSAPISAKRLLSRSSRAATAYLAIEPPDAPWPAVKPGEPSAGPFYLVWQNPKLSNIGPEEWPFRVVAFTEQSDLRALYPHIVPDADATAQVHSGFQVFTKQCFPCHKLNRSGAGEVGPDLNVPMNPTEYLTPSGLRTRIRDTQSLHEYPRSAMNAFPPAVLPETDLDALIAYLTYMSKHKVAVPHPAK